MVSFIHTSKVVIWVLIHVYIGHRMFCAGCYNRWCITVLYFKYLLFVFSSHRLSNSSQQILHLLFNGSTHICGRGHYCLCQQCYGQCLRCGQPFSVLIIRLSDGMIPLINNACMIMSWIAKVLLYITSSQKLTEQEWRLHERVCRTFSKTRCAIHN